MRRESGDHSEVIVTIDDRTVARADGVHALAHHLESSDDSWNILAGGERIELSANQGALGTAALFVPNQHTIDELKGNVGFDEVVDVGVSINGTSWGWAHDASTGRWLLLPCEFATEAQELFSFSATQELSMTGMAVQVTCRTMVGATVAAKSDDIDGLRWLEVTYEREPDHLTGCAATVAFSSVTNDYDCPNCLEQQGWFISVHFDSAVDETTVLRAMNENWQPCDNHLAEASIGIDLIGFSIRWVAGGWTFAELRPSAR